MDKSKYKITSEKLLLFLIVIVSLYRIYLPFIYNPINNLWSDPGRWWEYGSTGMDTPPLALIDPVLYQAWLSMVAKFTLGIPELTALYAGVLSVITPWLWYRFLRELVVDKKTALIGWLIIAILPSWIGIYSYFMSETLLLPLLGLALWLCLRSLRKQDVHSFILASFIATLCILTRGIVAPMLFVVLFIVWLKQKNKLLSAFYSILLCSFILGSLTYRNYIKTGLISPLGQSMLNSIYAKSGSKEIKINYYSDSDYRYTYGFVNPSINSKPLYPFSNWTSQRQGKIIVNIDLINQALTWEKAKENLEAKLAYGQLVKENLLFLFFGSSWPDNNSNHPAEFASNLMRFIWLPLSIFAVIVLIKTILLNTKDRDKSFILLAIFIMWFIFQGLVLLSVNEGRYRKPIEAVLISMVLFSLGRKSKKLSNKQTITRQSE